jgi:hypothetical protein
VSQPPHSIKLYHIVHVDRLASILRDGHLYCDAAMAGRANCGTTIGIPTIKDRRRENALTSHPTLRVGDCVPFYFCPRSIMLYVLYKGNYSELDYRDGQGPIIHLQLDLQAVVDWANAYCKRWAFTLSNAGARFFEDRADLAHLDEVNWEAVQANDFRDSDVKEGKQAEFLVENCVPWTLVEEIGMHRTAPMGRIEADLTGQPHRPARVIRPEWYY